MDERFIARFWSKVDRSGECWEWTACLGTMGYGRVGLGSRQQGTVYAHHAAWRIANGDIPAGMFVCHRCDNRRCVRPDHLFLGTHRDNMVDMLAKGRSSKGHPRPAARKPLLRPEQVRTIRASTEGTGVLAARYGVTTDCIVNIMKRRSWASIE